MTLYSAAYRDQRGQLCLIDTEKDRREVAEAVAAHANDDDRSTRFFVAALENDVWTELE